MKKYSLSVLIIACIIFGFSAMTASAVEVVWTGEGTTGGFCNNYVIDSNIFPGFVRWEFELTSPGEGPHELTYSYTDGPAGTLPATPSESGEVTFFFFTSVGIPLASASATGGTEESSLLVSRCVVSTEPLTVTKTALGTYTKEGTENVNHQVEGVITISNPEGNPNATITGVIDTLNASGNVAVECPGGLPQALAGGATLECAYSTVASEADTTNTVTVTTIGAVPGDSAIVQVLWEELGEEEEDESGEKCRVLRNAMGPIGLKLCLRELKPGKYIIKDNDVFNNIKGIYKKVKEKK